MSALQWAGWLARPFPVLPASLCVCSWLSCLMLLSTSRPVFSPLYLCLIYFAAAVVSGPSYLAMCPVEMSSFFFPREHKLIRLTYLHQMPGQPLEAYFSIAFPSLCPQPLFARSNRTSPKKSKGFIQLCRTDTPPSELPFFNASCLTGMKLTQGQPIPFHRLRRNRKVPPSGPPKPHLSESHGSSICKDLTEISRDLSRSHHCFSSLVAMVG